MKSVIRRPSLDEWFLIKQLEQLNQYFHLPFYIDVDISHYDQFFKKQHKELPATSLLVKFSSYLLVECPYLNKMMLNTFWGYRFIEFPYNRVNLPLMIERDEKKMLSAMSILDAWKKSSQDIKNEIKMSMQKSIADLPLNKIIHYGKNNVINRLKLRCLLFLNKNFPQFALKYQMGGISVSSLLNVKNQGTPIDMMAYGANSLTISSCSLYEQEGKKRIKIGIAYNHMCFHGQLSIEATNTLIKIISCQDHIFQKMTASEQ